MDDYDKIVRDRQRTIRRQIDARQLLIKAIQMDAGWENSSTLLSYFPADSLKEPATMSVAALFRLLQTKALPIDLLSLLLPAGMAIVEVPENIDHDELADAVTDYLAEKQRAHHPESECGPALGPKEKERLNSKVVHLPIAGIAA